MTRNDLASVASLRRRAGLTQAELAERAGLRVETFRPQEGTHAVTAAMKAAMLQALPF